MKRGLGVLALILLILLGIFFLEMDPKQEDESIDSMPLQEGAAVDLSQDQRSSQTPDANLPDLASGETPGVKPLLPLNEETKNIILSCTKGQKLVRGVGNTSQFSSLGEFLELALTPDRDQKSETKLEILNVHVRTLGGEVQRLHLVPQENATSSEDRSMRIRLFGVDAENLPEPIPLPESLDKKTWQEAVEFFKSQGTVIFEEKIETQRWGQELGARITTRNGEVPEMELHFANSHLLCGTGEDSLRVVCRCF